MTGRFAQVREGTALRNDRRVAWLVAALIAFGLLSAVTATVKIHTPFGLQHILIVPLFALTFCRVSLLGLWAVFSPSASWTRLSGLVIGTACLEAEFDLGSGSEFVFMVSSATALTVASLLVARLFGVRLIRQADGVDSRRPEPQRFRFSIRGLMALTAVVALLITVGKADQGSRGHPGLVPTFLWSFSVVTVGLLALRAVLGIGHPTRRGISTVAVSSVLGAFFALVVNAHRDGWVYITLIMLLYPTVLLGSLLVVRASDFRLVRTGRSHRKAGASRYQETAAKGVT